MTAKENQSVSLEQLAAEINAEHEACQQKMAEALQRAIRAGGHLKQAKAMVQHGAWMKWVKTWFAGSHRTATLYMKLHDGRESLEANWKRVTNLGLQAAAKFLEIEAHKKRTPVAAKPTSNAEVRSGDLWQLGEHRLLCGDCSDRNNVRRLMAGEHAQLLTTDPPYGVKYNGTNRPSGSGKDWGPVYDDDPNPQLYLDFVQVALDEAVRNDAAWYVWHASSWAGLLDYIAADLGLQMKAQIIWNKSKTMPPVRSLYSWAHEPCWFGCLCGTTPPIYATQEPYSTVWNVDSRGCSLEHPTSKPLELFYRPMRLHTLAGEIVYDPFCGSGTAIIAAERLKRRSYSIELKPHFCDVIIRRWENETGKKAVRIEGRDGG